MLFLSECGVYVLFIIAANFNNMQENTENWTREYVTVDYDKGVNCLCVAMVGYATYEEFVGVAEYEYQMIRRYKIENLLINLKGISVYPQGGQEYIKDVWFARITGEGVRKVAFVVPEDIFGKIAMDEAHVSEMNFDLVVQYFSSDATAKDWLKMKA